MIYNVFISLFLFSVKEVSVPADQPAPRKNKMYHDDNYELITSVDDPLSAQIKYIPTFFKSNLF